MKGFFKLALRNLARHKRRAVLTGLGMVFGGFFLVFGRACADGLRTQMFNNMIALDTGHLSITAAREGEQGESDFDRAIRSQGKRWLAEPEKIVEAVSGLEGVSVVSRRIESTCLFFAGPKMYEGVLTGIEPEKEADLIQEAARPVTGRPLQAGDAYGIYISEAQTERFGVGVGDSITVSAQTAGGGMNTLDFLVTGIYAKNMPWHDNRAYINLGSAQELMLAGNGATKIKVLLEEANAAGTLAARLQEIFRGWGATVEDWRTAGGFYAGSVIANTITFNSINLVLLIIIAAGVMNTMLTAVFERFREIGMMAAMGAKRRQIRLLFLAEAVILTFCAGGLGILLGSLTSLWLGKAGIPAFLDAARYAFGGERMYPLLTGRNVLVSFLVLVLATLVSSYYPARLASRLHPAVALQRR
jgi:putative ABC transport system permease protein